MAKTATHDGTCQWCGRVQRLPGGRLADHGYEIEYGFRNGVCHGARELPFEQSCDLVRQSIEHARKHAAELIAAADALDARGNDGGVDCMVRVYHPELSSRTKGSVYLWTSGTYVFDESRAYEVGEGRRYAPVHFVPSGADPTKHVQTWSGVSNMPMPGGDAAKAAEARADLAKSKRAHAADRLAYAERQERSLIGWTVQPLRERAR